MRRHTFGLLVTEDCVLFDVWTHFLVSGRDVVTETIVHVMLTVCWCMCMLC